MRYGMNPHQSAHVVSEHNPLRPLNSEPSLINHLDSLNAWQLVRSAQAILQPPIAASFKHLSPAGVAVALSLDPQHVRPSVLTLFRDAEFPLLFGIDAESNSDQE